MGFTVDYQEVASSAKHRSDGKSLMCIWMTSSPQRLVRELMQDLQRILDDDDAGAPYAVKALGFFYSGTFVRFLGAHTVGTALRLAEQKAEKEGNEFIIIAQLRTREGRAPGESGVGHARAHPERPRGEAATPKATRPAKRAPAPRGAVAPISAAAAAAVAHKAAAEMAAEAREKGAGKSAGRASTPAKAKAPAAATTKAGDMVPQYEYVRQSKDKGGETIYGAMLGLYGRYFNIRRCESPSDAARVIDLYLMTAGKAPVNFTGEVAWEETKLWLQEQKASRKDMITKKRDEIRRLKEAFEAGTGPGVDAPVPKMKSGPQGPRKRKAAAEDGAPTMGEDPPDADPPGQRDKGAAKRKAAADAGSMSADADDDDADGAEKAPASPGDEPPEATRKAKKPGADKTKAKPARGRVVVTGNSSPVM